MENEIIKKDKFNINKCECVKIKSNINNNSTSFSITELNEIMTNFKIVLYFNEKLTQKKLYKMMNNIIINICENIMYPIINIDGKIYPSDLIISGNETFRLSNRVIFNIITNLLFCSLIKKKLKIKKNKITIPLFYFNENFSNLKKNDLYFLLNIKIKNIPYIINKINLKYLKGFETNKNKITNLSTKTSLSSLYRIIYSQNNEYYKINNNFMLLSLFDYTHIIFISIYKKNKLIEFPNIKSLTKDNSSPLDIYYEIKKIKSHIKNFKLYLISFGKFKKIKKQIQHKKLKQQNLNDVYNLTINFDCNIKENYKINIAWLCG